MRKPLFAGRDYADQLVKILALIGKPSPEVSFQGFAFFLFVNNYHHHVRSKTIARIPEPGAREFVGSLRNYIRIEWSTLMPSATPDFWGLIDACLAFSPDDRMSAKELLKLPLFAKFEEDEPVKEQQPALVILKWKESEILTVEDSERLLEEELKEAHELRMKNKS